MMRKAAIKMDGVYAGLLTEDEQGYQFQYDHAYLAQPESRPVSLTLPLQAAPYTSKVLFPFFDGLIPEGWMLQIAEKNWKLHPRDRMGLLLVCCKDCIGAVTVEAMGSDEGDE
jgi:serine/threonine-protein kinase HipA